MSKLSLTEIRQSIHHVTILPHIQGCLWHTPGFAPTSLSTQLNKPGFRVTDPPGLGSSHWSFSSNLSVAAAWDIAPQPFQTCHLWRTSSYIFKVPQAFCIKLLDFNCCFRSGPAHNPESSTPDQRKPACSHVESFQSSSALAAGRRKVKKEATASPPCGYSFCWKVIDLWLGQVYSGYCFAPWVLLKAAFTQRKRSWERARKVKFYLFPQCLGSPMAWPQPCSARSLPLTAQGASSLLGKLTTQWRSVRTPSRAGGPQAMGVPELSGAHGGQGMAPV